MWPWRENAHTSVRNTATRIPAGCLDNPHQPAPRVPRAGPSSPPSCLTRRGRVRSAWWLTAAPSLTERSGVEAGATKWPAFAFCLPTLVPILQVAIPVRTAPGRRSPWVRQPITPLPLHPPVKSPKEKSTCDSPVVRLGLIPHVIQLLVISNACERIKCLVVKTPDNSTPQPDPDLHRCLDEHLQSPQP